MNEKTDESFGSYLGLELYYFLQGKRLVLKEDVYTNAINEPYLLSFYGLNKPFRILVNSYLSCDLQFFVSRCVPEQ